jgi:hypothetical protein
MKCDFSEFVLPEVQLVADLQMHQELSLPKLHKIWKTTLEFGFRFARQADQYAALYVLTPETIPSASPSFYIIVPNRTIFHQIFGYSLYLSHFMYAIHNRS